MIQQMQSTLQRLIFNCMPVIHIAFYAALVKSQAVTGPQLVPESGILLTQTQGLTDPAANCSVENVVSAEVDWLAVPAGQSYTLLLSVAFLHPLSSGLLLTVGGLMAALNKFDNGGDEQTRVLLANNFAFPCLHVVT